MKNYCKQHGCHFPEDFNKSLKCDYWDSMGLKGLDKNLKRMLWLWVFEAPFDLIYGKSSYAIEFGFRGKLVDSGLNGEKWEEVSPGYNGISETKKKELQREFYIQKDIERNLKESLWQKLKKYIPGL